MDTLLTENAAGVNSFGLALTLVAGCFLIALPRRHAMLPILFLVCYMTMGDRVMVSGLNFTMIRILLVFGWLRLIIRREFWRFRWNSIDTIVVAWTVARTVNYTLVWGTSTAFVNRLGYAYNIVGYYFLFRCLVRHSEDVFRAIQQLAVFIGPLALLMLGEKISGKSPFAMFGGVPLVSEIRDGVVRCQGPFAHPILAGTFGATNVALIAALWWRDRPRKWLVLIGVISALAITTLGGSSGPTLAFMASGLALILWPMRRRMRLIRWGLVVVLFALQLVMNSPVWFLMARLTVFSGSTGWFRGYVVDMAIRHFSDWWLIGTNAAPKWHFFLLDITNQYVAEAFDGGLLTVTLFIAMLALSFRSVGRTVRLRKLGTSSRHLVWALGAALFAHTVTFISVTYFDQNFVMLYFLLAAISAVGARPQAHLQISEPQFAPAEYLPRFSSVHPAL